MDLIKRFEPYKLNFDNEKRKKMFGEILIELRKKEKISQQEVADALQISQAAYRQYESGQSMPNLENLVRLSYFFNVSIDILLCRSVLHDNMGEAINEINEWYKEIKTTEKELTEKDAIEVAKLLEKVAGQFKDIVNTQK